ncbi:MFS transporter [Actinoplanes sp. DH11]|uniref:MFS transporter n=1 Tax=Actinoplanes sp. DH11 TaxID=2857011 RepID=UPI001E5D7AB6|nr:MFS transporter [Actinoplanes sp. DH11]
MQAPLWRRVSILAALALSAFIFNTTENLPIGLLSLISDDLGVSLPSAGFLVTGYGLTVAVVSLPLAAVTQRIPRRYVLTALLAILVISTLASVLIASYPLLFGARVVTAIAQALFWAVLGPTAVGLFPRERRGRVIAVMSVCGSLATVLGVPAGTWLAQHSSWQTPFLVITLLGLVALVIVAVLLPTTRPEESHGAFGSHPDTWRFAIVIATTVLSVTGMFAGFTYITEFLTKLTGYTEASVGGMLFVFGAAGTAGVVAVGPLLDRLPRGSLLLTVGLQGVSLLMLGLFPGNKILVVVMLGLLGFSAAPVFMATQARILRVAPGRTEIGFAANSAGFNVGVAAGSLIGGLLLSPFDARAGFLVGAALTALSVALLLVDPLLPARPERLVGGEPTVPVGAAE